MASKKSALNAKTVSLQSETINNLELKVQELEKAVKINIKH